MLLLFEVKILWPHGTWVHRQGPEWIGPHGPDVVICYSNSEAWDYMPLVSSVIPANLGFSFTLLCRHNLRLERTGNMEKQMAFLSARFICWRMFLLLLVQILQSGLLAVRSCPSPCACSYGNSGIAELRLSEAASFSSVCHLFLHEHYSLQLVMIRELAHYWRIGTSTVTII